MARSSSYVKHLDQGEPPPPGTWPRRLHHYYYHRPSFYFCGCFCFLLLIFLIVLGVAALIVFLVLSPHKPRYFLQDVQINSLTITTSTSTATYNNSSSSSSTAPAAQEELPGSLSYSSSPALLSTDIVVIVQVYNRNHHIGIFNNRLTVVLYFSGTEIGRTMLPSFFQDPQDTSVFQSSIVVQGYPIMKESVAADISDAVARGTVPLHSLIATRVKYKIWSWEPGWHRWFYTNCNLLVGTSSSPVGPHILYRNC